MGGGSAMPWKQQLLANAPDRQVAEKVSKALDSLLSNDRHLLECDVNERAITHRLAVYLEPLFPGWHVDCEYNRDGHEVKVLSGAPRIPDIIVHQRGTPRNLLTIEVKKSNSHYSREDDREKLLALQQQLGYRNALFLELAVGPGATGVESLEWVEGSGAA